MTFNIGSQNADIINNAGSYQTVNVTAEARGKPAGRASGSAEPLRILYLTSAPQGDLRVDREVRKVKEAVRTATVQNAVLIEHQPAATGDDLLNGLTRFRPHVIHFSGHGNDTVLAFDSDSDGYSAGHITAGAFAAALAAVDNPPRLVVLNACNSKPQLHRLIGPVSAAIGMSDRIQDVAAIAFAARLYAAIADGQSIHGAFKVAKADVRMRGLTDAELPVLTHAPNVNPGTLVLVRRGR